jgi:hypothetical protein
VRDRAVCAARRRRLPANAAPALPPRTA